MDHRLVRSKIDIMASLPRSRRGRSSLPFAVHELAISAMREEYREKLEQQLRDKQHSHSATSEQNWSTLKDCIVSASEESLGRGRRKHPEESADTLLPLIEAKNRAHQKAIQTSTTTDRKEFRRHQRLVKRAVDKAKEEWICRVAKGAEAAVKDGCVKWERVRSLQQVHMGRKTIRPRSVWKEDGTLTQGSEDLAKRWSQHFQRVLNIPSEYREQVIDDIPLLPPLLELDLPPTDEELTEALTKLKIRKAGEKSGILPELVHCGGCDLEDRIL